MHSNIKSLIPNLCPTIQFNSDTNCPELAWTQQVKGSVSQDCPHFRHQPQVLGVSTHFWLVINMGLPTILSGFANSLEQLVKVRKLLYLQLPVYYKGYKQPDEEVHQLMSRRVLTSRCIPFGCKGKIQIPEMMSIEWGQ